VAQAISSVACRLAEARIERAAVEARSIVRHVTGRSEEDLVLQPETPLSEIESAQIEELAARRAAREPLPYVLGWMEFYSRRFHISSAAIVPRPETEILAEATIVRASGARLLAEVGAGSGALAITLAMELPNARVVATDISRPALHLTAQNIRLHQVGERVYPVCCDLLSALRPSLDCVVANLPYIATDDFAGLEPEVRDFEPRIALNGGADGLGLIRRLCVELFDHLNKGGFVALEVGAGQACEVAKLLICAGLRNIEVLPDYAGLDRVVIGWRRG
jgi:release factor glutamine methyltransferase